MSGTASQFVGDIPARYDAELGPNIFVDYAADLAARVSALKPPRALELAAGTGIASRKLRDVLPADAELVITDLNAPMLEVARGKFAASERVRFEVADAMALPFADASFDLIACQFGVMFFPDKIASFREALRVLRPGGRYIFNAWGAHTQNLFARVAHETVLEFFPDSPPGFYRVPFSYADPAVAVADLRAAGFTDVQHDVLPLQKTVRDIAAFAHGLVFGNPLIDEVRARGGDPESLAKAIEARLRTALGGEPAVMPLFATIYTATR